MRILSWNVNGLRAAMEKGFRTWLSRSSSHIVGVQEVRATEEQLAEHARAWQRWHRSFSAAERPGYSGVGLFSKIKPDELVVKLGGASFDAEGRFQLARFGRLIVVNAYFPNGSGKDRDNSRIPFKLAFYRKVFDLLEADRRKGAPILVMGDFNTAHRDIDLARPKQNAATSGFTIEEREEMDRVLRLGFIDTFRRFEPGPGHYTWWSQRFGVRAKNIGWRIDYVLASPEADRHIRAAFIQREVVGSDHCPVGVDIDDEVVGPKLKR